VAKTATNDAQNQSDEAPKKSLSLLAQEEFGEHFHGNVEPPRQPPTPAPTDDEPPGEPEEPQPQGEEGEEDDYQPDENAQVEGDEKAEASKPDDEGEPIATVRELVDHLEADAEWFNGLKVDVLVHDKTSQVPLKDLVASYQQNQAADERLEQAKTKHAQAQEESAKRAAETEQQYLVAAKLVESLEQQLTADIAGINWDQLHRDDPALWSAERVRMGERQQQINQTKAQIAGQYQQMQMRQVQDFQTKFASRLEQENQQLMAEMPKVSPEWGDPEKLAQRKAELTTYLIGQGFSRDDVLGASDHRLLITAEKARLWDLAQGKAQVVKKRIAKVPKVMKPGAKREPSQINLEKVRDAQKRLRSTGRMEDALSLLRANRR
jgi:hypothetical protein